MDTLFLSDIHLCPERPDKIQLFQELLRGPARRAGAVYLLGDVFENFWLGNDDHTPPARQVLDELRELTGAGVRLYLIRGNRELMMDQGIEALTGATLLPDGSVIDLDGEPVLVCHGDVFCTRDVSYQIYRRFVETAPVRTLFLALPYRLRVLLVRGLKPVMKQSSRRKAPAITDVTEAAVLAAMEQRGVATLIHGHTHRPGVHEYEIRGRPARRIVLGDWYQGDSVLVCRNGERSLMGVRDYLDGAVPPAN